MKLTRMTLATASSVLLLGALASCGNADDDTTETDQTAADAGPMQMQMPASGGFPGASGLVADVDGRTAQVQSAQSGQVAVSWTSDTTFTEEVDASLDDVTVGTFVMVTNADDDTAASVRILPEGREGMEMQRPEGAPTDMPTDMPEGDRPPGGGLGTVGEVTAVTDDGFTISANDEDVTVTVTGDTTYTTTADATSDAVETGVCVTAQGDSDDTGAVTATSINVTDAVDGECRGGFMMGAGGPGGAS